MNYLVRETKVPMPNGETGLEFSLKQQDAARLQGIARFSITGLIGLLK